MKKKEHRLTLHQVYKIVDDAYDKLEKLSVQALRDVVPDFESKYEYNYLLKFSNLALDDAHRIRNQTHKQVGKKQKIELI